MTRKMSDGKAISKRDHASFRWNKKICGQCHVAGHELADCTYMRGMNRQRGDMSGCPMCNTTSHTYDECRQVPADGDELLQHHMEWLVRRRCHLPMISSKVDIWILVLGFPDYNGGYPWSKAFTSDMGIMGAQVIIRNQKYNHGKFNTGIVDPLTSSLAQIKRHINFEVPQETDTQYFRNNLLAQGIVHRWTIPSLLETQNLSEAQRNRLQQTSMPTETNMLATVFRAGAISAPDFAQKSIAFAEAFGDFLLHENPKGMAGFAPLTSLKDQALRRVTDQQAIQPKNEDEPAIAMGPIEKASSEHSALMPLVTRQEIWRYLCPKRKCVGGFPFEVPVPAAVRLQKHVVEELENETNSHSGKVKDTIQRKEESLANYIHPHVRIDVTQRKLPDGRSIHVLLLGLVEDTYDLRFSRLGLLQAYDMVVCWASRINSDGISISLKSAFDGCNQITEDIVAGNDRINELAVLERRLERLMPDISQFDEAVERISQWMERRKAKLVSSPEDRERRLRKWCEKQKLGDMGNDLLEQACQQAVEVKTKEWKKSKQRTKRASFDDDIDGARPTKRRKKR
ncbi:uncharacterized protein LY79DRAFT_561273 [Colletotrichum navitas]|uniref:Uncharacterized protein n=1 Tax=Colletotrichum navitas TaxID=681940 RepID=A0AAD8PV19_9PEZI|nr:uncharacterized protein LY79DRAFT_561273 [Colletotrichum navitas]KAK1580487.1 hypothetical protein LY79DRAFT_561273 [Colletotrichum navitas]